MASAQPLETPEVPEILYSDIYIQLICDTFLKNPLDSARMVESITKLGVFFTVMMNQNGLTPDMAKEVLAAPEVEAAFCIFFAIEHHATGDQRALSKDDIKKSYGRLISAITNAIKKYTVPVTGNFEDLPGIAEIQSGFRRFAELLKKK